MNHHPQRGEMMSAKHTVKPWELSFNNHRYTIDGNGTLIVHVERDPVVLQETWDRQIAYARLIAAAPDLLEALKKIAFEPIGKSDATYREVLCGIEEIAKQAITKAEVE
jgi:hypothetical protein